MVQERVCELLCPLPSCHEPCPSPPSGIILEAPVGARASRRRRGILEWCWCCTDLAHMVLDRRLDSARLAASVLCVVFDSKCWRDHPGPLPTWWRFRLCVPIDPSVPQAGISASVDDWSRGHTSYLWFRMNLRTQ
jgi:hypothetical protein